LMAAMMAEGPWAKRPPHCWFALLLLMRREYLSCLF
jgi:hypothetical protein